MLKQKSKVDSQVVRRLVNEVMDGMLRIDAINNNKMILDCEGHQIAAQWDHSQLIITVGLKGRLRSKIGAPGKYKGLEEWTK